MPPSSLKSTDTVAGGNGLIHGGDDGLGPVLWDFSTNSNPSGLCPAVALVLSQVDVTRYPDPSYAKLTAQLADFHGVDAWRIVLAASASEAIARLTRVLTPQKAVVQVPPSAYGEYAHAAKLQGHSIITGAMASTSPSDAVEGISPEVAKVHLHWLCDPHSPTGEATSFSNAATHTVLDRAYHPLRLAPCGWTVEQLDQVWQLFSPNKAMGATGVRGAYVVAPAHAPSEAQALRQWAPSWVLGVHGVAMLQAWASEGAQNWLAQTQADRQDWAQRLRQGLAQRGWVLFDSVAPFTCGRPPQPINAERLRAAGLKLRPTDSMGLPGHWRINALPIPAQQALFAALDRP